MHGISPGMGNRLVIDGNGKSTKDRYEPCRLGRREVWVSDLVFGFRLDPCHDLLEFIGHLGTGSH